MMVPSDHFPSSSNKRSLFFGEATIFLNDSKIHRTNDSHMVRMGYFWYWFRKRIVLISLVAFSVAFTVPYLFLNSTDGFILSGGVLSLVFGVLAQLSYLHILPWRRHPSSLLIQVCGMSTVLSAVAVVMAYPDNNSISSLNDGSDINLIGSNDYSSKDDHTPGCMSMSFLLQLTLFAREMWILTLSLDLLTNITNPFASYKVNLRKYHASIWSASILSAILLISQTGDCQGEFLNNGTCWLKISGAESGCFWGYFMAWVILFYLNAITVLSYAISRISKGLESTYATHYAFVVDTFRIVFFFFLYGVMLASLFLILYYATNVRAHEHTLTSLEHVFAFFIASRGFFDALIWFFTHGFTDTDTDNDETANHLDRADRDGHSRQNMQRLMKAISSRRLTMRDILKPKVWLFDCLFSLGGRYCCNRNHREKENDHNNDDNEDNDQEEVRPNLQAINAHEQGNGDVTTVLLKTNNNHNNNNHSNNNSKRSLKSPSHSHSSSNLIADEDDEEEPLNKSNNHNSMNTQQRATESTDRISRSFQTIATSNFDYSPQLNLALRAEVLFVVTLGIRESVLKLNEREKRLRELAEELIAAGKADNDSASDSNHSPGRNRDGKVKRSFSLRKGGSFDSEKSKGEEFVRIRLSSSSGSHRYAEVSSILRDIYNNNTQQAPFTHNNNTVRPMSQSINSRPSLTANNNNNSQKPAHHTTKTSADNANSETTTNNPNQPKQTKSHHHTHTHSQSFNPHASMAFHSIATSSILHSLMSVTGAYLPGEYGVDSMSYLENHNNVNQPNNIVSNNNMMSPRKLTRTNDDNATNNTTVNPLPSSSTPTTPTKPHANPLVNSMPSTPKTPQTNNNAINTERERESKTMKPFESHPLPSPSPSASQNPSFYLDNLERYSKDPEITVELPPPPAEVIFKVNDNYRFRDFRPATFRTLRHLAGMSDEQYLSIISQPAQEKLSEGRSGAFFFVCGEGDVIVKTVEASEATTLLSILDKYVTHLMRYPESLLVRFFGLHSIRMYGNEFTFVVMKNIFPKGIQLNEKYDIKGSYVMRNATLKMPGKLSTCRYCQEQFIEGSNERCSEVIGGHEAIITLKDNDMINKIRLYPGDAYQIIDTLLNDSDALCDMGLMDYSLLVGVKHGYYDIEMFKTSRHFAADIETANHNNTATQSSQSLGNMIDNTVGGGTIQGHRLANSPLALNNPVNPLTASAIPASAVAPIPAPLFASDSLQAQHIQAAYPARAVIAPKEYYFGVIDVLQTWSMSKKIEHWFKVYLLGQPADGVSCVDPVQFKHRYQSKIMRVIEHEAFVREVTGSWMGKREVGNPFTLVSKPPDV